MPPRPRLGQLRSPHPSVLITAPSAKSITMAAAGTVASANPQLTHGLTLRPRVPSPHVGSATLWVPLPTVRSLLASIPSVPTRRPGEPNRAADPGPNSFSAGQLGTDRRGLRLSEYL